MSDKPIPPIPAGVLTQEQIEAISGGADCTPQQWIDIAPQLTQAYETLVEFTTYVMERVAGKK
jgi:hypothetical protein